MKRKLPARNARSSTRTSKPDVARELGLNAPRAATARDTGVRRPVRDPSSMSPNQRLSELGAILALGFRRLLLSRERGLDVEPDAERTCVSVNNSANPTPPLR